MSQKEYDILNLFKRQLEKKSNQPKHFPLFTRFELNLLKSTENKKIGLKYEDMQVYKLHSFANSKFSLFNLYQCHFPSLVKEEDCLEFSNYPNKYASNKDEKHQLSQQYGICQFFGQLVIIVGLKSLLFNTQSNLIHSQSLLINQVQNYVFEKSTQILLKNEIITKYQMIQNKLNLKDTTKVITFQTCKKIFKLLQQSKLNMQNRLITSGQTSSLLKQKYLFPKLLAFNLQNKKQYLASSLSKLYRLPAFFRQHKQKIIRNFVQNCKQYSEMVYSDLQPDFIVQLKKQTQKAPVLIGLVHYLNLSKNKKIRDNIRKRFPLMLDVASYLLQTKILFTSLNVQSIIFNQKSLKPHLSQTHLLTAGLGLQGDIGSLQLKLASNPTPKPIQFQQCYLQKEEANLWWLDLKLLQIFKSQQDRLQMEQIIKIKQKIYVWRIICVLFYILNDSKHMMWTKYRQKYGNNEKQDQYVPFDTQKYWALCKDIYDGFSYTSSNIRKALQIQAEETTQQQKFEYSMEELKILLNLQLGVKKQSTQTTPKNEQMEVRKFRRILINNLRNYLQTGPLFKKLNILHRNILVLLTVLFDQTCSLNQKKQFPDKCQQFLEKLQSITKKIMVQIQQNNKQCADCNICKIARKCKSLIALHKASFNMQQCPQQITCLCLQGLQQLILKEITTKQKEKGENQLFKNKKLNSKEIQNKQHLKQYKITSKHKQYYQLADKTIVLLLRTLKTMKKSNLTKLKTFVIPFLTYINKNQLDYTHQQWQQRKIRLAVATEIIESQQKRQKEITLDS